MKSNFLGLAGFAIAMSMMSTSNSSGNILSNDEIVERSKRKPKKVIPKGCKEYHFTPVGRMLVDVPLSGFEIVFTCIASSDKKAKAKFEKWRNQSI